MEEDHWGLNTAEKTAEKSLSSVLAYANSTNPYLKQASIMYAAIGDALYSVTQDTLTDVHYFSGFINALTQPQSAENSAALAYLLAQTLPKLATPVLNSKAKVCLN